MDSRQPLSPGGSSGSDSPVSPLTLPSRAPDGLHHRQPIRGFAQPPGPGPRGRTPLPQSRQLRASPSHTPTHVTSPSRGRSAVGNATSRMTGSSRSPIRHRPSTTDSAPWYFSPGGVIFKNPFYQGNGNEPLRALSPPVSPRSRRRSGSPVPSLLARAFREYRARRDAEVAAVLEVEQRVIDDTAVGSPPDDMYTDDDSEDFDLDEWDYL
ncbi:hypothetical protein QBC34DRAFT_496294 [Podospora aff. communis PSN243]|uniref:Uncharacterized protein n=1 Tax=Podospora aff. communis PSN243 TaxID=3040156 RepID=A0AAV9GFF9_9PEZI|nr:hypothetical protein QBC34DRAFT_496294 [Podospora aff. communis PSN243]